MGTTFSQSIIWWNTHGTQLYYRYIHPYLPGWHWVPEKARPKDDSFSFSGLIHSIWDEIFRLVDSMIPFIRYAYEEYPYLTTIALYWIGSMLIVRASKEHVDPIFSWLNRRFVPALHRTANWAIPDQPWSRRILDASGWTMPPNPHDTLETRHLRLMQAMQVRHYIIAQGLWRKGFEREQYYRLMALRKKALERQENATVKAIREGSSNEVDALTRMALHEGGKPLVDDDGLRQDGIYKYDASSPWGKHLTLEERIYLRNNRTPKKRRELDKELRKEIHEKMEQEGRDLREEVREARAARREARREIVEQAREELNERLAESEEGRAILDQQRRRNRRQEQTADYGDYDDYGDEED